VEAADSPVNRDERQPERHATLAGDVGHHDVAERREAVLVKQDDVAELPTEWLAL
jgi:hypothetical protein